MKEIFPNYYDTFSCVAGACKHSCCIGWEIDIDESTMAFYESMDTEMGRRIRKNIEGEPPHFILGVGDRCPFLNDKGLCDIICDCGEDALCDICHLHPRFRNFYSDFAETGLGLCCEEAARIVLSEQEPFVVALPENVILSEEEELFFARRQAIFNVLQDRSKTIKERFFVLAEACNISLNVSLEALCKMYASLERLDENWTKTLENLQDFCFDDSIFEEPAFQLPLEQLAVHFVFRHLTDAMWDGEYSTRVRFAVLSCYVIGALWAQKKQVSGAIDLADMVEFVRMYSAEVEYSEENLEVLLYAVL